MQFYSFSFVWINFHKIFDFGIAELFFTADLTQNSYNVPTTLSRFLFSKNNPEFLHITILSDLHILADFILTAISWIDKETNGRHLVKIHSFQSLTFPSSIVLVQCFLNLVHFGLQQK